MGGFRASYVCTVRHKQRVWLITWVTQLSLCQAGCISCLPMMLTELEMSRLIVQALLPCMFCTGMSHEAPLLGNPDLIYTQGLWMLVKTELWVLMKQIWGTYLGSHCSLFNLPVAVLPCGTPAQKEQQNCVRALLEGLKWNLSVWAVPASSEFRRDPGAGDRHSLVWPHRKIGPFDSNWKT